MLHPWLSAGAISCAVGLLSATTARPSARAQTVEANSARVDSLYARYGPETPGVTIRILVDGQVVHTGEYGMANLEHHVPITPTTQFPIGSASKQFTGMAISMLAADGTINLDADIHSYVPDLPDFGVPITPRQLLHHTSGIRDWVRPFVFAGWHAGDVIDFDEVMEFLRRQRDLNFEPGARYMYSNTGYVLLAALVQQVTGSSYPDWMRSHIFEPLGMASTRVRTNYWEFFENMASSYYPVKGGYGAVPSGLTAYGSCCIVTTADDLVKWVRNFDTAAVGGRTVIQPMFADTVGIREWDGRLVAYGYGLEHFDYHGHRGLFHSGQWVGYRAGILMVPSESFAVVALSNAGPSTNLHEWDVVDLYLGDKTPELAASKRAKTRVAEAKWGHVHVPRRSLERCVGSYDFGHGEILTVTLRPDTLMGEFASDDKPYPLTAVSATAFQFRVDGDTLRFEGARTEPATNVVWKDQWAGRFDPFQPTATELEDFTGAYYSQELEATLRFRVEDGALSARNIRWGQSVSFLPTSRDQFRGKSDIQNLTFARDDRGRVTAVRVSGRRALNLLYVRIDPDHSRP